MRGSAALLIGALLAAGAAACGGQAPTPAPNAVVHFRNFVGHALAAKVQSGDTRSDALLRPCGGAASIAVPYPSGDDPRVLMGALYDTTGALDVAVEQSSDLDTEELLDHSVPGAAIIWSTGEIGIDDLPRWVTFRPLGTDVDASRPLDSPPMSCATYPPVEDDALN